MLEMMSLGRSLGTSEGIHSLRLRARPHVRPRAITSRDVDVSTHDLFEIGCDAGVREEIASHIRREIHEEIDIAIGSVLGTHDRTEDRHVHNAPLTQFDFVSTETCEDVREQPHALTLPCTRLAYNAIPLVPDIGLQTTMGTRVVSSRPKKRRKRPGEQFAGRSF